MQLLHRGVALIVCLVAVAPGAVQAQMLSLGLRGGIAQTTVDLDTGSPGTRTTGVGGPMAMFWLSDAVAIEFAALYIGKGFAADPASGVTTSLSLSYLDVPILAVFSLPRTGAGMIQARLQAGPAFGFRVRCSVDRGTGDVTGITDCDPENVGTFDLGVVGGLGIKVGRGRGGLLLDATYNFGVLDANLNPGLTAKNRALSITAGFLFPIM